jgi:hypothetical protein
MAPPTAKAERREGQAEVSPTHAAALKRLMPYE